ncbi:MAG: hypothetical protein OXD36_13485 [Rhodobacter sp.]|nr:hypothetical protein [Rhodobacter sp.]
MLRFVVLHAMSCPNDRRNGGTRGSSGMGERNDDADRTVTADAMRARTGDTLPARRTT